MVNWKKEIENSKNIINISFIDYDNIKFYTMKDLDEHFNKNKGNKDNTNDNEFYNYINNKYKKEEEDNKNIGNNNNNININNNNTIINKNKYNKNNYNKNNYNKNKYNNLFAYYYTYFNKKIIFLSPNFTSQILKTLIL